MVLTRGANESRGVIKCRENGSSRELSRKKMKPNEFYFTSIPNTITIIPYIYVSQRHKNHLLLNKTLTDSIPTCSQLAHTYPLDYSWQRLKSIVTNLESLTSPRKQMGENHPEVWSEI